MSELNPFIVAGALLLVLGSGALLGALLFHLVSLLARRREERENVRWLEDYDREASGPDPRYDPKQFRRR